MRITHVAIFTINLEKLKNFYIKYFNGKANELYHNKKTGLMTYFISFDNGCKLEIMSRPDITEYNPNIICGFAHLAFCVDSKDNVDTLVKILTNDGYKITSNPRTTGDGYYEACVLDPDGNQIEITA